MRMYFLVAVLFTVIDTSAIELKNCSLYGETLNIELNEKRQHRPIGYNENHTIQYELDSNHRSLNESSEFDKGNVQFIGKVNFSSKPWLKLKNMDKKVKSIQCAEHIILSRWDKKQKKYNRVVLELVQAGPEIIYEIIENKKIPYETKYQCSYLSSVSYRILFNAPVLEQKKIICDATLNEE